jgi:hypothetical protein
MGLLLNINLIEIYLNKKEQLGVEELIISKAAKQNKRIN